MAAWQIIYTKAAIRDIEKAFAVGFKPRQLSLLGLLREDPFVRYPAYEKLLGDLTGCYSRRINHKQRLVYTVDTEQRIIKVISAWSHYEN